MAKRGKENHVRFSDFLTAVHVALYKAFGEPDMSQDWLELFTDTVIDDLRTAMHSCSDNQRKAEYVEQELGAIGFTVVGEGTNIVTMANPVYPGVVFKIALDDNGIADNYNDCILQHYVPHYMPVLARHPSSIVSVQPRGVLAKANQIDQYRPRIIQLLKELSKRFLIVDLSPNMFLNYVVGRDGDFIICDGSDLYPLANLKHKPKCVQVQAFGKGGKPKRCGGQLHYNDDFSLLICDKCGAEYNPLEFRPNKESESVTNILFDGTTAEDREALEAQAIRAIRNGRGQPKSVPIEDEDDEVDDPIDIDDDIDTDTGPMVQSLQSYLMGHSMADDDLDRDRMEVMDNQPTHTIMVSPDGGVEVIHDHPALPLTEVEDEDSDEDGREEEDVVYESDDPDEYDSDTFDPDLLEHAIIESIVKYVSTADSAIADFPNKVRAELRDSLDRWKRGIVGSPDSSEEPEPLPTVQQEPVVSQSPAIDSEIKPIVDGLIKIKRTNIFTYDGVLKEISEKLGIAIITAQQKLPVEPAVPADMSSPTIAYSIISDSKEDDAYPEAIYIHVVGDVDEAFEAAGLPMFIAIDGGDQYYRAITSDELKDLLLPTINEIKRDLADSADESES